MDNGNKKYIGKYQLEKVLGKGAMGVVYLAKDPTIGRNVAIKCIYLSQGLESDKVKEFRERFLREARAAGVMNHPNIVTIYEADEGGSGGPPFIAMEYIEGETWNHMIKSGKKLAPDQLFPMLREIASSLEYAHAASVVHRDIKPGNIIQTKDGRAKLMDFGIAKVPTSELTREGQFLGTPAYMSPEQVQGKPVDHRCDIFSLGAVAYEMISGRKPFDGEEITSVLHKIVSEEPRDIREMEPEVGKEAWAIIKKMLRKNPEERYASASELMADIEAYLAGALPPYAQDLVEKTAAPQAHPVGQERQKNKNSRPLVIIGAMSFMGLLGAAILVYLLFFSGKKEEEEPWIRNSSEAVKQMASGSEEPPPSASPGQPASGEAAATQPQTSAQPPAAGQNQAPKPRPKKQAAVPAAAQPPSSPPTAQKPIPAKLFLSFDLGGTKKGEASLSVDDKLVRSQKIEKGLIKDNIWTLTVQMPAGKHKVKVNLKTEIMGVDTANEEEYEFLPGKTTTLKVKIGKFSKKLSFAWSE